MVLLGLVRFFFFVACLMAFGAGGTWLLGHWLGLAERGVSRAALGWLGWAVGLGLVGLVGRQVALGGQ